MTTGSKPWTNERLAGLFGIEPDSLTKRFYRSEQVSGPAGSGSDEQVRDDITRARRLLRDPEMAAAVLADPEIQQTVRRGMATTRFVAPWGSPYSRFDGAPGRPGDDSRSLRHPGQAP